MQVMRFINGGYAIHHIKGDFKGNMSAWFDKDGKLLDAEQIPVPFGSSRRVKPNGAMWQLAEKVGQRSKHIPVA